MTDLRLPPGRPKKYVLIEAVTLLVAIAVVVSVMFVMARDRLAWEWLALLTMTLIAVPLILQLSIDNVYKPRWGLFLLFALALALFMSILVYSSDRPSLHRSQHFPQGWLDLVAGGVVIVLASYMAENVFRVIRPWMAWREFPNVAFEVISSVTVLVLCYLLGVGWPEPDNVVDQLLLGGSGLIVALAGFWLLPMGWMPRAILLPLLLGSFGLFGTDRLLGDLIVFGTAGYVIVFVQDRVGSLYDIWRRHKGLTYDKRAVSIRSPSSQPIK